MTTAAAPRTRAKIACRSCRHRSGVGFRDLNDAELEFMTEFKEGHEVAWAGEVLLRQGEPSEMLGTLYSGLAIKCRTLPTGKRHILAVLMPGDLIGLENAYGVTPSYTVEAVTDVTYCRFDPARWRQLLHVPDLADRAVEALLAERRQLEDRFSAVAGYSARRSVAHFVLELHDRLARRQLMRNGSYRLPLINRQFAEALGLTTVHLHRVLRKFEADRIFTHHNHRIVIHDLVALRKIVGAKGPLDEVRPLI